MNPTKEQHLDELCDDWELDSDLRKALSKLSERELLSLKIHLRNVWRKERTEQPHEHQ